MTPATNARARQREQARQAANQARSRRADLKRRIHALELGVAELVVGDVPPADADVANELRLFELLEQIPGVGEATVDEILEAARVQGHRRLGSISMAEGGRLAVALRELT